MTPIRIPRFAGMRYTTWLAKAVPGAEWLQAWRELDWELCWTLRIRAFDKRGIELDLREDVEERVAAAWAVILGGPDALPPIRDLSLRLYHVTGCSLFRAERAEFGPDFDPHTGPLAIPLAIHTTTVRGEVA